MGRIILIILFVVVSFAAKSQTPAGYTKINSRYAILAERADSGFHLPTYSGVPYRRQGVWTGSGLVGIDTIAHQAYFYSGGMWRQFGGTSYTFPYSVVAPGDAVQLENDTAATVSNYFYGTNSAGRRTWLPQSGLRPYTFTNGLTESGGTVKLGGTLVDATTTINADGNNLEITGGAQIEFLAQDGGNVVAATPNRSSITVGDDVIIAPYLSSLIIDSLAYTLSTTGKKIMLRDTATGLVENIDPALIGVGVTPTWQQTLTAGSALTGNNTIDVNNNELMIDLVNTFGIADNSSDARIAFNSGLTKATQFLSGVISDRLSDITLYSDSIVLKPSLSNLYIDSLQTVLTTTGRKVLLHDTATGKVERIDPASLVSTPTLQQVLTAGSSLVGYNEITGDGSEFLISGVGNTSILSTEGVDIGGIANGRIGSVTSDWSQISLKVSNIIQDTISLVDIYRDSISLKPSFGVLNIDSLRTWSGISDTTYKKPMTWDTRNGRWEYASNWFGGMTNPMTTEGDLIVGGSSGTPTRLAIGTNNYVLKSNGTTASWQPESGGGLTVGTTTITSGTVSRVLFEGSGNVLQQDAGFTFDASTDALTIGGGATFNNGNNAAGDVVIKGQTDNNLFWTDASTDEVYIGSNTDAGSYKFQVTGNSIFRTSNLNGSGNLTLISTDNSHSPALIIEESNANNSMRLGVTNQGNGSIWNHNSNKIINIGGRPELPGKVQIQGREDDAGGTALVVNTASSTTVGVRVNLAGSQTGDAFQVYNSGATKIASIDANGGSTWSGRVQFKQGADVASANNLTLGGDGNVFEITGTTQINLINNTNWQNGSEVTLLLENGITVSHNTASSGSNITILLAGAANFTTTAPSVLKLLLSEVGGTQAWREVSRTVF